MKHLYVSVNSDWVPLRICSKNLLGGGSGFDFQKLPGSREFDKAQDFVENEIETSKESVDQIFTSENKNKWNFLPFTVCVFQ